LIETIEQNQRVGARFIRSRFAMFAILLKKGLSFTATGNFDRNLSLLAEDVNIGLLDRGTRDFWIGWDEVDIALDGIRSSLLDLFRIAQPNRPESSR
jgi:hypothetical protein